MFERRVKIFLAVLILATCVLVARAMQIQVVQHDQWNDWAVKNILSTRELIQTTRGRLLDRHGRPIADNQACIDACVDFRAIDDEPDKSWVREIALARLKKIAENGDPSRDNRAERAQRVQNEIEKVHQDIQQMWRVLARLSNMTDEQMHELRQSIVQEVEAKRQIVWNRSYQNDLQKWQEQKKQPTTVPWYQRWMQDDSDQAPDFDKYKIDVREQFQPHVIKKAISDEENNFLGKNQDSFPGLVLQPGIKRYYPYNEVAAHVIGHMSQVSNEDLKSDPNTSNELKSYWRTDQIGRSGLEAMCEPLLRGLRGRKEYLGDKDHVIEDTPSVAGMDVTTTIDIKLQQEIENAFTHVEIPYGKAGDPDSGIDKLPMPGAAVVIDVPSGDVLAMVSYPSYDLNTLDDTYATLVGDQINRALTNRATQFALEPGSTVKPMVGLGAITQGLFGINDTIECTGYLVINGHKYSFGRCWTMSMYGHGHHDVPIGGEHPTGFLTFHDALERSCNVFFETLADRLGMDGLHYWYSQFGLGHRTEIGIPEVSGRIPGDVDLPAALRKAATWFSGIGQSQVHATPIQMANVAATIARDGIWAHPHLVPDGTEIVRKYQGPDRIDLLLSKPALAMAKAGMIDVVNGGLAATGASLHRDDLLVAGKTGTAQAAPLKIRVRELDASGHPVMHTKKVLKPDSSGNMVFVDEQVESDQLVDLPVGTHAHQTPEAPWYRGIGADEDKLAHSWFIGFAPADKPKIAFAVMVEYGGSGGNAAGFVARKMLDACINAGYLQKSEHGSASQTN